MQGNSEATFTGCSFVAGDIAYRDGQLWVAWRTPSPIPPSCRCPCPPCPYPCPFPCSSSSCCCSSLPAKHQLVPPYHLLHKTHAWEPLNATLPKSRGHPYLMQTPGCRACMCVSPAIYLYFSDPLARVNARYSPSLCPLFPSLR